MENQPKKLYRSEDERVIAGVCGGIAEYLKLDPTVVRVIFVILACFGGAGIVIYFILAFMIPSISDKNENPNAEIVRDFIEKTRERISDTFDSDAWHEMLERRRAERNFFFGSLVVIAGLFFLTRALFPSDWLWFKHEFFWPIILIFIGIFLLLRSSTNRN